MANSIKELQAVVVAEGYDDMVVVEHIDDHYLNKFDVSLAQMMMVI
jgi:hypothetical protein